MNKIILLFLISGIAISANSQTDLKIKLDTANGYGVFGEEDVIIWPSETKLKAKEVPSDIIEYCIRKFDFQPVNSLNQLVKKGKIPKDKLEEYVKKKSLNRQLIVDLEYNHSMLVLIGKISENEYIVILDKNNNESFSDDKKFIFPVLDNKEEEMEAMQKLPIAAAGFEHYNGLEIVKKTLPVKINPYKGSLQVSMTSTDPVEQKYFLTISFPFYRFAAKSINGKSYGIYAANGFTSLDYTANNTSLILVRGGNKNTNKFSGAPYSVGDIIAIDSLQYEFSRISDFGDMLELKFVGYNKFPEGFQEGRYLPQVSAMTVNRQSFDFKDYKGKYILLDFWGTWCGPCIKLIPQIKELNEKHKGQNFALVSVANDDDIEKVRRFIDNKQMNWIQLIDGNNNNENGIIKKLKISRYPTMVLIAPDGKIISRDKEIGEIDKLLTEKLMR